MVAEGRDQLRVEKKNLACIGGVGGYDTSDFNEAGILNNNAHRIHNRSDKVQ